MFDRVQSNVFQSDVEAPRQMEGAQAEPLAAAVINASEHPVHVVRDWIKLEYDLFSSGQDMRMEPFNGPRDFVLQMGRDFPSRPLPKGVRRRLPRQCFHNAASLALRRPKEFLYAEGYAFTKGLCTEHAWCIDREGNAVDITWRDDAAKHYFGVPFLHSYVRRQAREQGELGGLINVWDGPERWPLCTGAHPLAEAVADPVEWLNPEVGVAQLEGESLCR